MGIQSMSDFTNSFLAILSVSSGTQFLLQSPYIGLSLLYFWLQAINRNKSIHNYIQDVL